MILALGGEEIYASYNKWTQCMFNLSDITMILFSYPV